MTLTDLRGRRAVVVNWRDPWHRLAGGSERYAWEFAGALREAGASVELWTARDEGQAVRETCDGIDVRRRGGPYSFYPGVWARLVGERARGRLPDLVVDMDCGIPSFTPPVVGRRSAVLLVVHHVHQSQFQTAMRRPVSDLGRFLERRLMPVVYRGVPTLAVSDSTVVEMREQLGWRGEVRVVHNGIDAAPLPAEKSGTDPERVVVLGRLVRHKRVDLVVRAFASVLAGRPTASLDIVGTGPELARIRTVIQEIGIGTAVRVHGFLPENEKSQVLDAARLHVVASDAEGWGQVVLEAAAHGVPTLARDVAGVRDSVRDEVTGWLLAEPPRPDPARLTALLATGMEQALERLEDGRERERLAAGCRRWAAGFGWNRMHADVVDAVSEALVTRG